MFRVALRCSKVDLGFRVVKKCLSSDVASGVL